MKQRNILICCFSLCLCLLGCTSHVETKAGVDILMQDTLIQPGSTFSVQSDREITITNFQCRLLGETTDTIIAETQGNILILDDFTLSDKHAWQRNEHMFVEGEVRLTYSDAEDDYLMVRKVAYPYRPCQVEVQTFDVTTDLEAGTLSFYIKAYSNGSSRYVLSYRGYNDVIPYIDTIEAEILMKEYNDIPANQTYHMSIKGVNSTGAGEAYSMFFGVSEEVQLKMRTTCTGSTLWYSFYYGAEEVTDIDVATVEFISRDGRFSVMSSAKPRDIINLNILPERGVYMIRVTLQDGRQFSDTFMKR